MNNKKIDLCELNNISIICYCSLSENIEFSLNSELHNLLIDNIWDVSIDLESILFELHNNNIK
jgi:hypothetical protein